MKKIDKLPEPHKWIEFRNTPNVSYQSIPELKDSLYQEQGYICAYCMRRIPCKDPLFTVDHKIEHILCRDNYPELRLNYSNMVVCCPGNIGGSGFHCDTLKDNRDISFSPFDDDFIDTISYSKNGIIKSSNPLYDDEINNVLGLNNPLLKINRAEALQGVIRALDKNGWSKSHIKKYLNKWNDKDKDGKFKEYCGIVIYFLQKRLKQFR